MKAQIKIERTTIELTINRTQLMQLNASTTLQFLHALELTVPPGMIYNRLQYQPQ